MTVGRPILRVLLDEGAPEELLGKAFEEAGHTVIYFKDVLMQGSSDPLVAATAQLNQAILLAWDKGMRELARQHGIGKSRFRTLSLIRFSCREGRAYERARSAMSLIEHEWNVRQGVRDRRLFMEIGDDFIRTFR